jgi:hypothetical protein
MLEVEHEHEHAIPEEEPTVEIDLNALTSMNYESSVEVSDSDGHLSEEQGKAEEVHIVLALQAAPVNFSIEEIQPHELLSANPSEGSGSSEAGQSSARNTDDRELVNMQVGMDLLPDNLDVDPGLLSLVVPRPLYGNKSVDGVRLWAKYFALPESFLGTLIPAAWQEFFISLLLNPSRFDWAQAFLSFEAGNVILKDNEMEASLSFMLLAKCLVKRKIDCVCFDDNQVEVAKSQMGLDPLMLTEGIFETIDQNQEGNVPETPLNQKRDVKVSSTTSILHAKIRITRAPLVVTDVRRSIRLEVKNKGFKCDVSSQGKDCFCCVVEPPNFTGKAIRSLGKEFCKIPAVKMSEEIL